MDDLTISDGTGAQAKTYGEVTAELDELVADLDMLPKTHLTAVSEWQTKEANRLELLIAEHRRIDAWRAGAGRATYNASRRTKRKHPNADLAGMTDEQRNAHLKRQKADSAYRCRKKKVGWTDEQIAAGLIRLHAERHRSAGISLGENGECQNG